MSRSNVSLAVKRDAALAVLGTQHVLHSNSTFKPNPTPVLTRWLAGDFNPEKPETAEETTQ